MKRKKKRIKKSKEKAIKKKLAQYRFEPLTFSLGDLCFNL